MGEVPEDYEARKKRKEAIEQGVKEILAGKTREGAAIIVEASGKVNTIKQPTTPPNSSDSQSTGDSK